MCTAIGAAVDAFSTQITAITHAHLEGCFYSNGMKDYCQQRKKGNGGVGGWDRLYTVIRGDNKRLLHHCRSLLSSNADHTFPSAFHHCVLILHVHPVADHSHFDQDPTTLNT